MKMKVICGCGNELPLEGVDMKGRCNNPWETTMFCLECGRIYYVKVEELKKVGKP